MLQDLISGLESFLDELDAAGIDALSEMSAVIEDTVFMLSLTEEDEQYEAIEDALSELEDLVDEYADIPEACPFCARLAGIINRATV